MKLGAGKPAFRKTVFRDVCINGTPVVSRMNNESERSFMRRPLIRMRGCAKRYKQPQEKQYDNQDDVPFHKLLVNSYDRIILRLLRKNKIHAGVRAAGVRLKYSDQ